MPIISANGIKLACEESGPKDGPAVLLIMGLASQLTAWPPDMVGQLNQAGFRTVRYDNRDVGLSQKMKHRRAPNLVLQSLLGKFHIRGLAPYGLPQMARDASGLMDSLKISRAHVVGISMGGMIAQILAANQPGKVASLTALMTSTNNPRLPGPRRDIAKRLLKPGPQPKSAEEAIERSIDLWNLISTVDSGRSDAELRTRVTESIRRSWCPAGQRRQTSAIIETGDLRRWTKKISAPTLVIHGDADPLVNVAGGKDVAHTIAGARLEIIEGMGHDLPPRHVNHISTLIVEHMQTADRDLRQRRARR